MRIFRKRWPITSILYVMFFCVIVMPIVLVASLSLRAYTDILLTNITSRTMQTLEQVSYSIDQEKSRYIRTVAAIATDSNVISLATSFHRSADSNTLFNYSIQLENQLKNYLHDMPDVVSAMFVYRDGDAYFFEGTHFHNINTRVNEELLKATPLYKKALQNQGRVLLFGSEENKLIESNDKYILSAAIAPKYASSFNDVEMIYFVIQAKSFENLAESSSNQNGSFIVLDGDGNIMLDTSADKMQSIEKQTVGQAQDKKNGNFRTVVNGEEMFVTFLTMERTEWKIIYVTPYDQMTAEVKQIYKFIMGVSAAGLVIFLLVSFFLVRSIVGPIKSLILQMNKMKSGSFNIDLELSGPLEIYSLGKTFQNMTMRMKELIVEKREQEQLKNRAELDALQSQINPHFLVNTLNAIKIMAMLAKATNLVEMTDSLIKLLSSTFHRGGSYIQVFDEMQSLEKYIHIMKVRYGDRFKVEYDIDERVTEAYILKLLLQPIVENAIIHGFYGKEAMGIVKIKCEKQLDQLVITITDNGKGMEQRTRGTLLQEKRVESLCGIGIANVNDRIRLNYGEPYGLTIHSELEVGTVVIVTLPLLASNPDQQSKERR
ncbi:sensor histidine kinase [Paenibacillus sp. GCM10023248]|uniref:sensor histidine kinase n=1 Tax=unclassified Paenibacillus TaxID=185978 RepID=UPI00237891C5|nr:sensor histidine kinase [Paenibacillus sp. MAHUQ-63]MDD9267269.1 sensor histidine kinase [Paenibacillus sp. MAHUQ-63]